MTTGQPIQFPSDRNKYNNEFMESLQLQINLNQTNLEVNRLYKETGQLPASTQMMDTRSNEEKLADVHSLKQSIISDLRPIAEPMFASAVIQGVIDSPLNVDNSLFRYLAQNASMFAQTLSKKYKFGIAGDANDVMIMVQFLEDAYNKTKNSFQSIKGYINSNTNEGNKSRSNILSENDTDNLIEEIRNTLKKIKYIETELRGEYVNFNIAIGPVLTGQLENLYKTLADVAGFLPNSTQMQTILKNLQMEEYQNPNGVPNNMAFADNPALFAVLKVLKSLPRPSSVATLTDKLEQAFRSRSFQRMTEIVNSMINLFSQLLSPVNRLLLDNFKTEFIDRANVILARDQEYSRINTVAEIQRMNQNMEYDKNAQRVYVINPANDPANVADVNAMGGAPVGPVGPAPVQPGVLIPPAPAPAPAPAPPVGGQMDQRQWTNYVGQMVQDLNDVNLDALYRGIPNDPNLVRIDPIRYLFGVQGATRAQKEQACIQALVLNFGNPNYGPHAGVNNILHNRALGLGLSKPVKKGRGLYSPFGDSEINHKNLENNILTLRRKSKTNYMDLPSKHISKHMKNILHSIVGGKIANFEDIQNLNDEERNYLNKVISKSNLHDRLSVPAPSKDQADKDNHQWEVMRGEIMAGNDSHELVKKFKILTMKLTRQGLLPKNEVMELFEDLVNLGY